MRNVFLVLLLFANQLSADERCNVKLAIENTGEQLVVVGSRGVIMTTKNMDFSKCNQGGNKWDVRRLNSQVNFTNLFQLNEGKLWATAHDAMIFHSRDGGNTWQKQLFDPGFEQPLLDVLFVDENNGFAIGGLGLYLRTNNGGKSWHKQTLYIDPEWDEPEDFALNSIAKLTEQVLIVAGEAGAVYRSRDAGVSWEKLLTGYQGSYFKAVSFSNTGILLLGLAGEVRVSFDSGDSWRQLKAASKTGASLFTALPLKNSKWLLAGANGALFVTDKGMDIVRKIDSKVTSTITDMAFLNGATIVLTTEKGIEKIPLPQ